MVVRPVNDAFLQRVVFPAFELGAIDALGALQQLRDAIADEQLTFLLDSLLDGDVRGGFFTLDSERWLETVYRLLFGEWEDSRADGWRVQGETPGFAGSFDSVLQLMLMLEEPQYPYAQPARAAKFREDFQVALPSEASLGRMVCGAWEPLPPFAPDQVLNTLGVGDYRPRDHLAIAEWSHRSAEDVARLRSKLPGQLKRLLQRERERLDPLPVPEAEALLAHWLGGAPRPPLAVAFSGLGLAASQWGAGAGRLPGTGARRCGAGAGHRFRDDPRRQSHVGRARPLTRVPKIRVSAGPVTCAGPTQFRRSLVRCGGLQSGAEPREAPHWVPPAPAPPALSPLGDL